MHAIRKALGLPSATKKLQQSIDLVELALALSSSSKSPPSLDDLLDLSLAKQIVTVSNLVDPQVKRLFDSLDKCNLAQDAVSAKDTSSASGFHYKLKRRDPVANRQAQVAELVQNDLGFTPVVGPSSIGEEAGEGLFAKGDIPRGTVFAMYPGVVYMPYQLGEIIKKRESTMGEQYTQVYGTDKKRNPHIIQRYDGVVVNAGHPDTRDLVAKNPFAVGHKINHPPQGAMANSLICAYDFPTTIPDTQVDYLCNKYHDTPTLYKLLDPLDRVRVNGLVFVAASNIADGQEIFVNYRYNPNLPKEEIPDWYHPVDADEDARRWE